ncbi:MAG TPA: cbb3-type cytochrome c oxidase subunit I [Planctomycetota bacterium]|nr:cbb3-type cytochrome c oxidase subunit I [Planctomycetota bacterium]
MLSLRRFTVGRVLVVAILLGFSILLLGGWSLWRSRAPIPGTVVADDGRLMFTAEQIRGGQAVYQKYGLMDWGSVLGHGTYYGPDFTADMLHRRVELLRDAAAGPGGWAALDAPSQAAVGETVRAAIKRNRYDAATDRLDVSVAEAEAFETLVAEMRHRFVDGEPERGLPAHSIDEQDGAAGRAWVAQGDAVRQLAAFFWWTSWLAGVERPEGGSTYTNNWPFDPAAGNVAGSAPMLWSGVSVAVLLLVLPIVLLVWWRGRYVMEDATGGGPLAAQDPAWLPVHPSQRKALKFFVTAGALFLLQTLLGGYLAHHYVEGSGFYGLDLARWLPFTVAKTWHLQLAIFWIATAWMGLGIYVAPLIGGREPRGQGLLVDLLYGALVAVALGSLAGEWLGVHDRLGAWWWWLGHSGWELVELGKLWQVLLAAGFVLWLVIVYRGVRDALRSDARSGGLVQLFLVSAVAIPLMFCATFLMTPGTHLTMADYWRWWIVHLWVEGMFEVFAVVVLGLLLVSMGLVTRRSTARALKFQLLILLASGIVGIGHHYYWIGANELWIGLGSVFSALEVVPLTLLAVEAWEHWHVMRRGGQSFAYRIPFLFLIAVAFWNLFGAGVLGFLINLPIVSYYEHGSFLTANHGHAALMGVFGMLAIGLALYCVRNLVDESGWSRRLFTLSFWGLNTGLLGMVALTLTPVGVLQLERAATQGFYAARSLEFYQGATVHALLWLRILPDSIFIGLGVVPLLLGLGRALRHARPCVPLELPQEPTAAAQPRLDVPALTLDRAR